MGAAGGGGGGGGGTICSEFENRARGVTLFSQMEKRMTGKMVGSAFYSVSQ